MCFPKEPAAGAASQKKKEEERKRRKGEKRERGKGERERREGKERRGREGKERGKGEGERRRGERRERGRGGKGGGKGRGGGEERGRRKEKGERKGERKEEGKRKEGKKGWWIIPRRCTAVTGGRLTTAYYCPKPRACRFRNNRAADRSRQQSGRSRQSRFFAKGVPFFWWPKRVPGGLLLRARGGLYLSVLIGGSEICPLGFFS